MFSGVFAKKFGSDHVCEPDFHTKHIRTILHNGMVQLLQSSSIKHHTETQGAEAICRFRGICGIPQIGNEIKGVEIMV